MKTMLGGSGLNASVEAQVDPTHRGLRVSLRPVEVGTYGSYSIALSSGTMASGLAAASPIFAFRWGANGIVSRVTKVRMQASTGATAFAQGNSLFTLTRATALPSQYTGGANVTIAGKDQARATRFAPTQQQDANSAVGNIAIANTATLAAGSPAPTLDSNPMGSNISGVGANPALLLVTPPGYLIDPTEAARQPLDLLSNEGFVIKGTVPATGVWQFSVEVDWDEIDLMRYLGLYT